MKNPYDIYKYERDRAYNGEVVTLPLVDHPDSDELSKLGQFINLSDSTYMILGGTSGSGKTALIDSYFFLNLYIWWKRNSQAGLTNLKPHWIIRSMERPIKKKIAKWDCYLMYVKYGVIIDTNTIYCRPNKLFDLDDNSGVKLDGKLRSYKYLLDSLRPFYDEMFEVVDLKGGATNPTGIMNDYIRKALSVGNLVKSNGKTITINNKIELEFSSLDVEKKNGEEILFKDVDQHGIHQRVYQYQEPLYIKDDPNSIIINISDHVGKITSEKKYGTNQMMNPKEILDKHAEYMGIIRDLYGGLAIDVVQLNRNILDSTRMTKMELDINEADFQGTSQLYHNCDIAIGMLNPYKFKAFDYSGYDIKSFVFKGYNRFRGMKLMKSSDGIDDVRIGYFFGGNSGIIRELPPSSELIYNKELMKRIAEYKMNYISL